jgi:hypothetical protein
MKPEEIRYFLGGYASGTLSQEEQRQLFAAALEDQELFNALADEEALKEVLDDPESRGYLQAALEEQGGLDRPHADVLYGRSRMAIPFEAPAPSPIAAAPAPPVPMQAPVPAKRRNFALWGLLAAASLAAVTVVGLLQWNQHKAAALSTTVAMNKATPPPEQAVEPKPAVPAAPAPVPSAKPPAVPARKAEMSRMEQAPAAETKVQDSGKAVELRGTVVGSEKMDVEAALGGAQPVNAAIPSPVAVPATAPVQAAPKPTEPTQATAKEVRPALAEGAAADALRQPLSLRERSSPGANLSTAKQKLAEQPRAIGYRLFRKPAGAAEFTEVPLTASLAPGDEIVIRIQKNAAGTIEVTRARNGEPVALSLQTAVEARTVPLTVAAGMELIIKLQPAGAPAAVERVTLTVR